MEIIMDYNREKIREEYKYLFEHSLDYVYVHDLKGNILDANDIILKTLGYEREEITSISFKDLLENDDLFKAIKETKNFFKFGSQTKHFE